MIDKKTLEFNLKGNKYTLEFPNVGGFKQIEANKQILSGGTYKTLAQTITNTAQAAADIIDIEATLMVIASERSSGKNRLFENLKCNSFNDLDFEDYAELKNEYIAQVLPWWNDIMSKLGLNA